eukprot:942603-Amphidinium_carterae.1
MRSLLRTQRISIGVLSELFGSKCATGQIDHDRVKSSEQLADIFTKPLARPEFVSMSDKIGVKCFDDVIRPKRKQNDKMALPSSSHDDESQVVRSHNQQAPPPSIPKPYLAMASSVEGRIAKLEDKLGDLQEDAEDLRKQTLFTLAETVIQARRNAATKLIVYGFPSAEKQNKEK